MQPSIRGFGGRKGGTQRHGPELLLFPPGSVGGFQCLILIALLLCRGVALADPALRKTRLLTDGGGGGSCPCDDDWLRSQQFDISGRQSTTLNLSLRDVDIRRLYLQMTTADFQTTSPATHIAQFYQGYSGGDGTLRYAEVGEDFGFAYLTSYLYPRVFDKSCVLLVSDNSRGKCLGSDECDMRVVTRLCAADSGYGGTTSLTLFFGGYIHDRSLAPLSRLSDAFPLLQYTLTERVNGYARLIQRYSKGKSKSIAVQAEGGE